MNWNRKHRPKKVSDLHLSSVREALLSMMAAGRIPQVMLFAGPKGTGKTSLARIIGALLNDPQNAELVESVYFQKKSSSKESVFAEPDVSSDFADKVFRGVSFVVQEMDAASHRGIDDVRALRERVMLPPQEGKMAIYILDEAHMLTNEAFNALLKILEEPPPHAVFILATTELHKIPETIASRCTTIRFHKASDEEIRQALTEVLKKEKIKFKPVLLDLMIDQADGSFRDGIKLLELACQSGKLTSTSLEAVIGLSLTDSVEQLLRAVLDKNGKNVTQIIQQFRSDNINQATFYRSLFGFLHHSLMQSYDLEPGKPFTNQVVVHFLLTELLAADLVQSSPIPFLPLELKLLELITRSKNKRNGSSTGGGKNKLKPSETPTKPSVSPSRQITGENVSPNLESAVNQDVSSTDEIIPTPVESKNGSYNGDSQQLFNKWDEFLQAVAQENSTLAALLRSSKPINSIDGLAKIGVYYRFHQEQLQQPKFLTIIEDCSRQVVGEKVKFDFLLQEAPIKTELMEPDGAPDLGKLARSALLE